MNENQKVDQIFQTTYTLHSMLHASRTTYIIYEGSTNQNRPVQIKLFTKKVYMSPEDIEGISINKLTI